jgi:hypothetical protein
MASELTVENMDPDGRHIRVARFAFVLPGVRGLRRLYEEPGGRHVAALLGYHGHATPGTIVAHHSIVVIPEDKSRRFPTKVDRTRQVYRAASPDVQLRTTKYCCCRHCNRYKNKQIHLQISVLLLNTNSFFLYIDSVYIRI